MAFLGELCKVRLFVSLSYTAAFPSEKLTSLKRVRRVVVQAAHSTVPYTIGIRFNRTLFSYNCAERARIHTILARKDRGSRSINDGD